MRRSDFARLAPLILETDEGREEVPDYPAIAIGYAEAVATERLPTNRFMVLAARRYLDMLELAENPRNSFCYSAEHVVDYLRFQEKLRHFESGRWELTQTDEDGLPDPRVILEPFAIWIESAIHGFRRSSTGERIVTTALELEPRKSAKSERAGGAALFDLCCSGQLGPQIPIAAATIEQSKKTLFGDILQILNNDKEIVDEFDIKWTKEEIRRGDGVIFPLTSQGERHDGLNPSLAIFEEGHAGAMAVFRVVESAFGARPNALLRMITTAGYRPEGPAWDLLLRAKMVLEGDVEDYSFFSAIYTLDECDYLDPESNAIDWDRLLSDEALVARANPMYDVSLDPIKVRSALQEAKRFPPKRPEMARTRFNIWVGSGTSLIDLPSWMACKRDISLESLMGMPCWIGVDLAQVMDMCAIALLFELPDDVVAVFVKYFLPEASPTAQDPELADQFMMWDEAGWLKLTPGPLADHDMVREEVDAYCDVFDVKMIACDPAQAHNTVKHLWDGLRPVMTYPNSAKTMTAPTDDILGRIAAQKIWHDGNPVLAWNSSNVFGERKGNGSIMPRKETPGSKRKIDGFVAICFANGCRMQPDEAKSAGSDLVDDPYLHRGILGFEEIEANV